MALDEALDLQRIRGRHIKPLQAFRLVLSSSGQVHFEHTRIQPTNWLLVVSP